MADPNVGSQEGAGVQAPGSGAARSSTKRIGRILVEDGAITQEDLDRALAVQAEKGGFIGQILLELGLVKQETIVSSLVKQCKIPHLSLLDYEIGKEVLQLIPKEMCLEHGLLPIDKLGRILTVAMINPLDVEALEEVRALCPDLRIKPILCDYQHFKSVTNRLFGTPETSSAAPYDMMKSLGLGPAKAKTEPPPAPAQTPPPVPPAAVERSTVSKDTVEAALNAAVKEVIREAETAPPPPPAVAVPPVFQASPPFPVEEFAAKMREGFLSAMQEAVTGAIVQTRAQVAGESLAKKGVDPTELATLVRDGVSSALRDSLNQIKPAAGPSAQELATVFRDSVGGMLQQAISSIAAAQTPPPAPAPAPPSAQEMAAAFRDGVGTMIQQSFGELAAQIQAANQSTTSAASIQELGDVLKTAVREAIAEADAAADKNERATTGKKTKGAAKSASVTRKQALQVLDGETDEAVEDEADDLVAAAMRSDQPLANFTFENFLAGSKNQFTVKVCQAVAARPGTAYNPLFLWGGVGLGKTHLINAIGNAIVAADDSQRIGYVSASHFTTRLADAVRDHALEMFRDEYCHWDVLILDDVQLLGGRPEAQEEFFHIFSALQQQGRQIIIAADRSPDQLGILEQRLVSRFSGGMVTSLKPADWDTRLAILRQNIAKKSPAINDETLGLIATRVPNDVRKMIGALHKVVAYAELMKVGVSCEMANDVLAHLGDEEAA